MGVERASEADETGSDSCHISDDPINLEAAGLGFTFVNMVGVSVGVGLSTAADTFFAQTYGFRNYKRVGIVLQRAILILLLTAFPVIVLCLSSEFLMLLMRQTPCVVRLSANYVKIFSIAIPSIVLIFVVVGIIQNIVSAVIHPLLLYVLDWGVLGAAAALVVAHSVALIFLLLYIKLRGLHHKTWDGWSWSNLREWWPFLRLGLPGMLMVCLEWWAFEIGTVICGVLGETELAVNSVLFNTLAIFYMLGLGTSVAATVRVGNELGAGNPTQARRAAYMSLAISAVVSSLSGSIVIVCRYEIGKLFTSRHEVIEGIAKVCYITGPLLFFDLIMITAAGVLKGFGQQVVGAITNFVSYYMIGIPLAIYLALYRGLGVMGVWIGLALADFIQMLVFILVIIFTNWKKQAEKAVKNAQDRRREPAESEDELSLLEHEQLRINEGEMTEETLEPQEQNLESTVAATARDQSAEVSEVNNTEQLAGNVPEQLNTRTKLWLLLSKGVWFLLGIVIVVVAGVVSYFESVLPSSINITTGNHSL